MEPTQTELLHTHTWFFCLMQLRDKEKSEKLNILLFKGIGGGASVRHRSLSRQSPYCPPFHFAASPPPSPCQPQPREPVPGHCRETFCSLPSNDISYGFKGLPRSALLLKARRHSEKSILASVRSSLAQS